MGELDVSDPDDTRRLLGDLSREVQATLAEGAQNASIVDHVIDRFANITGARSVRAAIVPELLRDFPVEFLALFEREVQIVMIAGDIGHALGAVGVLVASLCRELASSGLQHRVAHVGRLVDVGAQGAAYAACEQVPGIERIGLAAAAAETLALPLAPVHKALFFGAQPGDETWLVREMTCRGIGVVLGGDDQALAEARDVLARRPSRAVICRGFDDRIDDLGPTPGATSIADTALHPVEAGQAIARIIAEIIAMEPRDPQSDLLLQAVFSPKPNRVADYVSYLHETAARNRIVRLITAVGNRLERAGVPSAEVSIEVSRLGQELVRHTIAVDNVTDNTLWQQRAREAFLASGAAVRGILEEAATDIHYASQVGIRRLW